MRILHVTESLLQASGITVFCGELSKAFVAQGHEVKILVRQQIPNAYPLDATIEVVDALKALDSWKPEVVHLHGMWLPFLIRVFLWAKRHKIPLVWSTHGCLTDWSFRHKWLKKRIAWLTYQRLALRWATLIHTTGPFETKDIRTHGLPNEVVEVPLGVTVPQTLPTHADAPIRTALFLSYIHRKKGLLDLIDAWAELRPTQWRLVIAGDCEDTFIDEVKAYAKAKEVEATFVGEVFGEAKEKLFQEAHLFVLPSRSENFGVVVLEALAHGLPVLTTNATPWTTLEEEGCGWSIEVGAKPLTEALRNIFYNMPQPILNLMGERGYSYARQDYAWPAIAQKMLSAYTSLMAKA